MTARPKKLARKPVRVPIEAKLRWSVEEVYAMVDLSPNYLRELERKGEFPPRATVRTGLDDEGGKKQFVASEVRAWADGRDWRALVAARLQVVAHAS